MLNKINKIYFALGLITLPIFASAAVLHGTTALFDNVYGIVKDILIPLVFSLALLLFFWGMVKYIWSEGQGKEEGKKFMIWGVVALFVMSSIWGIIYFIGEELMPGQGYDDMKVPTIIK
jgi:hypothetical protein